MKVLKGSEAWKFLTETESREIMLAIYRESVQPIIQEVKLKGEEGVIDLMRKYYGESLTSEELEVTKAEMSEALARVGSDIEVLERVAERIRSFYEKQLPHDLVEVADDGSTYGIKWTPLERVGIHVPESGEYAYVSNLLYTAIPAKVAGVNEVFMFTPPVNGRVNPYLLAAAKVAEVDRVFKIGGPIAVAVMAYGTTSIPAVQKIFGSGDSFFMTAKQLVAPDVPIDFPSNPPEHVVVALHGADPDVVAWELLAQAEHGVDTFLVLITHNDGIVEEVSKRISEEDVPEVIKTAIDGAVALVMEEGEIEEAINVLSPSRVSIFGEGMEDARLVNVGQVLYNTPSPIADYSVGIPQRLPTSGYSRRRGGLTIYDFIKAVSFARVEEDLREELAELAEKLAVMEGMNLHAKLMRKLRSK